MVSCLLTCQVSLRLTSRAPGRGRRCSWSPTTTRMGRFTITCVRTFWMWCPCWNWRTRLPMALHISTPKYTEHKVNDHVPLWIFCTDSALQFFICFSVYLLFVMYCKRWNCCIICHINMTVKEAYFIKNITHKVIRRRLLLNCVELRLCPFDLVHISLGGLLY